MHSSRRSVCSCIPISETLAFSRYSRRESVSSRRTHAQLACFSTIEKREIRIVTSSSIGHIYFALRTDKRRDCLSVCGVGSDFGPIFDKLRTTVVLYERLLCLYLHFHFEFAKTCSQADFKPFPHPPRVFEIAFPAKCAPLGFNFYIRGRFF